MLRPSISDHRGIDGRDGSANMIIIFIAIMLLFLLGLVALYLYNSGAFTKTAPKL